MEEEGRGSSDILTLAHELLDDIELGRLPPERLLLKATRLARLTKDEEKQSWLSYELIGYSYEEVALKYMDRTLRWTDREKRLGYWYSFPEIEARIEAMKLQMSQLRIPDIQYSPKSANPTELVSGWAGSNVATATAPIRQVMANLTSLNAGIATLSAIRSRVLAFLHAFVSRVYYEMLFSTRQEGIFERQRAVIDARLADKCGDVFQKIPAVYDRLAQPDPEAISQALNTCRRIIDAFADSVFPPSDSPLVLDGKRTLLTAQHHQNRVVAFIQQNCNSKSRRSRLRRSLTDLYDRICAGVHTDVTPSEARFLFFQTYLLLGEILTLEHPPGDVRPGEATVPEEG